MPFVIEKDEEACSASEPWAVKTEDSGKVHGCHSSKEDAEAQRKALYANVQEAAAQAAVNERLHLMSIQHVEIPILAASPDDFPDPEVTYEQDGIVLCRIPDIQILQAGMEWPGMTGNVTFGDNHLSSAVAASADPMIPRPRIKLGHTDPRYNPHPCPNCEQPIEPDLDGDPSFGFLENLALENGGAVLSADLVDVPMWLAKVMPVAWPNRSIEGWFAHMGPNKKEYDFILTALALLGVSFPAILSLPDIPSMYGSEMPNFVEVAT